MISSSHQLSLKLIEKCPSCHAALSAGNIHIIDETDLNLLTHLDCPACHSKYMAFIVHHPQGLVGNAILTDLSYDEAMKYQSAMPINEDEFLELYRATHDDNLITTLKLQLTKKRGTN